MDQIDPYNVPELFRGVPRPKKDFQKTRVLAKFQIGAGVSKFEFSLARPLNDHSSATCKALELRIGPN